MNFAALKRQAKAGDEEAQYQLGNYFENRDKNAEAAPWYRLAGEKGHVRAQYRLGEMLREDDPREAIHWFQLAAEAGSPEAQYCLAEMLEEGVGIPKNNVQAFHWFLKSASMGNIDAYLDVGRCYATGCGTEKNAEEAMRWLRHLADPRTTEDVWSMPRAQFWMSVIFTDPEHDRVDPSEAYTWLNLAAAYAPSGRDFMARCREKSLWNAEISLRRS